MPAGLMSQVAAQVAASFADGLRQTSEEVKRRLKRNAPVDTGALRASIEVDDNLRLEMEEYGFINNAVGPHKGWIDRSLT